MLGRRKAENAALSAQTRGLGLGPCGDPPRSVVASEGLLGSAWAPGPARRVSGAPRGGKRDRRRAAGSRGRRGAPRPQQGRASCPRPPGSPLGAAVQAQ